MPPRRSCDARTYQFNPRATTDFNRQFGPIISFVALLEYELCDPQSGPLPRLSVDVMAKQLQIPAPPLALAADSLRFVTCSKSHARA